MTNEQALARLVFELDDIANCDHTWFARRRLKRLKRAIARASKLAMQPNIAELCKKIQEGREVLL